ncbi:MAG: ion transporter [Gammaproteobacteria bacterium]|nr:ion transporter [Gammaproteobacteria bacterium]MCP5417590.1 ion transporter [Chromatiaceae bacterium]
MSLQRVAMTLRRHLYNLLELRDEKPLSGQILNGVLLLLILVNVLAVILESVEQYHRSYASWFWYFEVVSVAIFTIEYLARVWVSVEEVRFGKGWRGRLRFICSPLALIDLLAILPFWLSIFFSIDGRVLRVFRLLRVFKLSRHFSVLEVLGTVLRNESKTLLSAIFVMIVLVILASAGIYMVEREAQPQAFGNIPRAMWWATVTLTTVGYGDVVPVTVAGRIFGILITVLGVGMAALPAGIIASGFTAELARRRDLYELTARKLLQDGDIDARDRRQLIKTREELGLERIDAQQLLRKVSMSSPSVEKTAPQHCPHCGKPLHLSHKNGSQPGA